MTTATLTPEEEASYKQLQELAGADERGTPIAYDIWDAQVALANHLTKHPGCEGDLAATIGFLGSPEGWTPGDGLIDPSQRPPPPPEADGTRKGHDQVRDDPRGTPPHKEHRA